ncbi:MAG: patatin-like phospholipase family protein [Burkholderiaceae bacterium]|nr:patatin-like phospholipase family protein [Burkholderiaceae bacterium]
MAIDGKTVGIALSGGGYRATLFGLGSLQRLNDAGLLGKLDRITSVSGGSILAGVLAHRWKDLQFDDGRAANFDALVVDPVRAFCGRTIDVGAGLKGLLTPFRTAGDFLAHRYDKDLFHGAMLKDIPDASRPGNPRFVFYATSLQTGRSFRFRQDFIADYLLGTNRSESVPLSIAVAASSAFPPVFSPIVLDTDPGEWRDGSKAPEFEALRDRVVLTDGGVYDNMGLESLVGRVDLVLVSDAGAPFGIQEEPWEDNVMQLGRVRDILIDQARALRKRWLIAEFEAGRQHGAYWGIGTRIGDYEASDPLAADNTITGELDEVPTRLAAFDERLQGRLMNWGYALCDAALRQRARLALSPAPGLPAPMHALA